MKHPILHLHHTERPVAFATSAVVKANGDTDIEADVFTTEDTDDVWDAIQQKTLNKFSIFGRRKTSDGPCSLHPTKRRSPCVTKSLDLWSISLVGDNAVNQDTYIEIVKANLPESETDGFIENLASVYKSEPINDVLQGDIMVPEPIIEQDPIVVVPTSDITKGEPEDSGRLIAIETSLDLITKSVGALTDLMKKESTKDDETKIEKAKIDDFDIIIKAKVDEAVGDIRKSVDTLTASIEEIKKSLDEMANTVIKKSGTIVYVPPENGDNYNPQLSNAAAIGG